MKTDSELEQDVRNHLSRQTEVATEDIDVQVMAGVVTLTGSARSELAKWNLADAISCLPGVNSLIDEVMVVPDSRIRAPNPDIARPWFPAE
jgi:osmotically-inducible protein OsmY